MKYMMFVVVGPDAAAEAEPSQDDLTIEQWLAKVESQGERVTGGALRPVSEAVTVRVSRGQVLVTDGPFCETKEWIAGFDILDCENLDEAIAIAARHPQANGEAGTPPVLDGRGLSGTCATGPQVPSPTFCNRRVDDQGGPARSGPSTSGARSAAEGAW